MPLPSLSSPGLALSMAWRGLRRSPGTSLLAVTVLALGLAAPVTFFSLLVGAIRPLPVPAGEDIVRMEVVQPSRGGAALAVRLADLEVLQGGSSLEAIGAFRLFLGTAVDPGRSAVRVAGAALTAQVLPLLRVDPLMGRVPGGDEAGTTLLLGYDVWQEAYGGDPGVLGRVVDLDGEPRSVVGIMPEGFGFPFKQNAWVIMPMDPTDGEAVEVVGRLASGFDEAAATSELGPRWLRRDALRDAQDRGATLQVESYTGSRGEGGEAVAFLGLVLVALALLLIACANVANLLLVRATERVRALGIQSALGAGRMQIGAQLLLEALVLAVVGGVIGVFLADVFVDAIDSSLAAEHFGYFWMRMAVDQGVLLFAGALVVGTALVSGTLPVFRVWGVDVQRVLKDDGAGSGVGGGGAWSRAFVTVQLALSCAALVAAGLSARSLAMAQDFGVELNAHEVLVASVNLPQTGGSFAQLEALESRLAAIPGIRTVALGRGAPGFGEAATSFELDGQRYDRPEDRGRTMFNAVTPSFYRLFGLELVSGRLPGQQDGAAGVPVAVVSRSFVRRHAEGSDILGRRIRLFAGDSLSWYTVVGLVEDVEVGGGERVPRDRVYLSLPQVEVASVLLMARGTGDGGVLAPQVRQAVAAVLPRNALWQVRTLADAHAYLIRVPRAMSLMALAGGAAGLLVAGVGLYGLLAFRVRQRRRELGVRLAMGADGARLARQTLTYSLRQVVPALVLGLAAAWVVAPVLGAFLMGQDPRAPGTYVGVAAAFLSVSLLASALPAVRAARVDPAQVLRGD